MAKYQVRTRRRPRGKRVARCRPRPRRSRSAMAGARRRRASTFQQLKEEATVLQVRDHPKKLKPADLMHFSRQLAAFVRAGIPLLEALEVIEEETEDKTLRKVLTDVQRIAGRRRHASPAALAPYENVFPQFYIGMLRSAELTGSLDDVLDQLSRYIKRDLEARSKVKSALDLPGGRSLLMSIVTVVVLVVVRAAAVQGVLRALRREAAAAHPHADRVHRLPQPSGGRSSSIGSVLLSRSGSCSWPHRGRPPADATRSCSGCRSSAIVLRYSIIERFCRLLAAMMQAGVPLPEAMARARRRHQQRRLPRRHLKVREAMLRGEGLARPMADTQPVPRRDHPDGSRSARTPARSTPARASAPTTTAGARLQDRSGSPRCSSPR